MTGLRAREGLLRDSMVTGASWLEMLKESSLVHFLSFYKNRGNIKLRFIDLSNEARSEVRAHLAAGAFGLEA